MRWIFKGDEKAKPLKVSNPCIGYCSCTSLGDEVCIGCWRTFEAVRDWNSYSEHEKVLAMMEAHTNYKKAQEKKQDAL